MNTPIITPATLNDLETLLRFEQGVVKTEQPLDPFLNQGEIHYYNIPKLISSEDTLFLVAKINQELVGCGYARISDSKVYHRNKKHAYVGFMYVLPEYRGQRISRKILDELKKWTLNKGIKEMRLDVYFNNESAIKAYQNFGFSKSLLNMRLDLEK